MVSPLTRKLERDVRRHKAQFIAVAVTMFLGVMLFAASYDSFQNLRASYDAAHIEYRFANLTIAGGDVEAIAAGAAATSGVESAHFRTVADVPLQVDGTKLLGRVVGMPAGDQPAVNQVKVLEGSYLDASLPEGVLVEEHMAEHFGLGPGDSVAVLAEAGWIETRVVGVVASPEYIWPARDRQNIITSPDNFGVVFGGEALAERLGVGGPNEVVLYYAGGEPDDALTARLTEDAWASGAGSVMTRDLQAGNAALEEDLKGFEEMGLFFPVLFLAAASMAAYVTISRLVAAQRPYIGVLLANGFTRRQVLRHYLGYGLLPGLVGSIPGAIAGVLLARLITSLYTDLLAIPITLIEFYPVTLAVAVGFGLLASLLAALAPALVASRVEPALAMRGETPSGGGKPSIPERVIPPMRRLPLTWRMAMRGVERNPRRTTYTIVGVVLSLMLVLVSWGMIDTIEHLMDRQFVEIQREDASVYFAEPLGGGGADALESVDGIAEAEPVLEVPVSFVVADRHYDTALVVMEADTSMHAFASSTGEWVTLPAEGLLVGSALEELLEIGPGDTVQVSIPGLGLSIEETVAGFIDEPLGTMSYVSRDRAEELAGTSLPATSAMIRYNAGADPAAIRAEVTELPQVAAFEDAKAIYNVMQDLMVLFYAFVGVMLVFGAAMAFALIFSAMSVNISERSREIATLLAVGTERRAISRYITGENMLVALLGIPIGLVVGYYMSKAAMATFSSDLFAFDLYVRPSTFLFAALAILGVALLSQWPGLRALRRIDIPRYIKERSA